MYTVNSHPLNKNLLLGLQYKDGAWRDIRGNIPEFFPKNKWEPWMDNPLELKKEYNYEESNKTCLIWTGK